MIKRILVICILINFVSAQSLDSEKVIIWSKDRKLKWSDYKGFLEENTPIAALSWIGLEYKVISYSTEKYLLAINAIFNCEELGIWMEKTNDQILKHEQLHFDIGEIYARKLRMRLLNSQNIFTHPVMFDSLEKYCDFYSDSLKDYQSRYDEETRGSLNTVNQEKWNNEVKNN